MMSNFLIYPPPLKKEEEKRTHPKSKLFFWSKHLDGPKNGQISAMLIFSLFSLFSYSIFSLHIGFNKISATIMMRLHGIGGGCGFLHYHIQITFESFLWQIYPNEDIQREGIPEKNTLSLGIMGKSSQPSRNFGNFVTFKKVSKLISPYPLPHPHGGVFFFWSFFLVWWSN